MKTRDELKDIIYDILSEVIGISKDQITEESEFFADLGTSCTQRCLVQIKIEERTGILVPTSVGKTLVHVKDIIDWVYSNQPEDSNA